MDMTSNYYIVFLIALVAAIVAMQMEQLGLALIAFLFAIAAFWLEQRNRKGSGYSGLHNPAPGLQYSEAAARRNRAWLRIGLPLAAVWIVGTWYLGARDYWLLIGPVGVIFVVLAWWAHDPSKPHVAAAMGVGFAGLGYFLFAK